ncbi:MAG: MbeB family mobilization protein, partial [Synergistaceae bacterium]
MSKILDLAKTFSETSKTEADSITKLVQKDLQKLETDIEQALNESASSLKNVILDRQQALKQELHENQRRMSWAVFRSWIWLMGLLLILASGLTVWSAWQGWTIREQSRSISAGKTALQDLPEGLEFMKENGTQYIIQSKKNQTKPTIHRTKTDEWVIQIGK